MDWSRYPLDKLFFFVAGIIPGSVALLIYQVVVPGAFNWFFALGFLGYRSKLTLIVLVAFVVGNSVTILLRSLIGGMYGAIDGAKVRHPAPYVPPESHRIAPWRDPRWRTVVMRHIGTRAPQDTIPIFPNILEQRRKMVELLPPAERPQATFNLDSEKLAADMADLQWEQWFDYYHQIVLRPDERDSFSHVSYNLRFTLEATAVYVLISLLIVPRLRHWWVILPAILWGLMLVVEEFSAVQNRKNKWSTLNAQITYLFEAKSVE